MFIIDVIYSSRILVKLKQFAEENDVIVKYERLKSQVHAFQEKRAQRHCFFFSLRTERPLSETLKDLRETFERRSKK